MLVHHGLCKAYITTQCCTTSTTVCHVRERVPFSACLVGSPLVQQVQHTVFWVVFLVSLSGFHDLVVNTQEGTKVLPFCIQSVIRAVRMSAWAIAKKCGPPRAMHSSHFHHNIGYPHKHLHTCVYVSREESKGEHKLLLTE